MTLMEKSWILSLQLSIGKQAKGKSRYIKDAKMLTTINCDVTNAATNVTVDFSFVHKKWRKYLGTLKDFLKISYYKTQLLSKMCILLQDTVIEQILYFITRFCYCISVSRYYLQDTKVRYCPSLIVIHYDKVRPT